MKTTKPVKHVAASVAAVNEVGLDHNDCGVVFETKRLVNNWEQYTGRYRIHLSGTSCSVTFDLPGRGGRVTRKAARLIHKLWHEGKSVREIGAITGSTWDGISWQS